MFPTLWCSHDPRSNFASTFRFAAAGRGTTGASTGLLDDDGFGIVRLGGAGLGCGGVLADAAGDDLSESTGV
jgi:hypothetical protein